MQVYVLLAILFVLYMLYKFIFRGQVINNNLSSAGIAKEYTNSMKLIAIIGIVLAHIGVQYHGTNYIRSIWGANLLFSKWIWELFFNK